MAHDQSQVDEHMICSTIVTVCKGLGGLPPLKILYVLIPDYMFVGWYTYTHSSEQQCSNAYRLFDIDLQALSLLAMREQFTLQLRDREWLNCVLLSPVILEELQEHSL